MLSRLGPYLRYDYFTVPDVDEMTNGEKDYWGHITATGKAMVLDPTYKLTKIKYEETVRSLRNALEKEIDDLSMYVLIVLSKDI